MKLVIVESPAKCKKIESYLGLGYKCCASFGHIRQMKKSLKNICKNPIYELVAKKSIKLLEKNIRIASEVILATDDDREGEAIAWHICMVFNLPLTTKRIIFHEITKKAVLQALVHPTTVNMNKVNSQRSRQILDMLVGFTLTPVLWKHISRTGNLSAGRCQTPALRLVYDNQKDIDKSPGIIKYDTLGIFTKYNLCFKLNKHHTEKMKEFLELSIDFKHLFSVSSPKKSIKNSPLPFTTSTLQQRASNELSYAPKVTMKLAQKLYEDGWITYMRTDSKTYSNEFLKKAKDFIKHQYGQPFIHKKINILSLRKKDDKNAQEAHEAIRPTDITKVDYKKGTMEHRLYRLIWRNTVQSCMSDAEYKVIAAKITAPEKCYYQYKAEKVVFLGWKIVENKEEGEEIYEYLLQKKSGKVNYKKIESNQMLKELKTHYTEARLVQLLEKKGIGRPSTFASLIAKIQERGYVTKKNIEGKAISCINYELKGKEITEENIKKTFGKEKNKLVIEKKGILVLELMLKYFGMFFTYDFTKGMENDLDLIVKGEKDWCEPWKNSQRILKDLMTTLPKDSESKIKIDEEHVFMIGRYGPVIKQKKNGETKFISVKKDINLENVKDYTLEELIEMKQDENVLGVYEEKEIVLKKGRYGAYVVYDGDNYSLKSLGKEKVTLEKVIPIITGEKNTNIVRTLAENLSIRKGKWGLYIFYKKKTRKKPYFWSLKKCPLNVKKCTDAILMEWIKSEYF